MVLVMTAKLIQKYVKNFEKLRVSQSHGGAPHKPILLLSVIEGFEYQDIVSAEIFITPELISSLYEKLGTSSNDRS